MNLVSNNENEQDRERHCHRRRHPQPGEAILRAGNGGVGPLPILNTVLSRPIPVASVTIDTTNMENPSVLLTFTSQINLPLGILVTLNFVITKSCDGGSPQQIGGTYTFSTAATALEAETFAFQFFECETCPGCCTYTVELSTNTLIEVTPGLTITNATLSALAVENER